MTTALLKVAPDQDLYTVWSFSVDNVLAVRTHREIKASRAWTDEQLRRADETGTSSTDGDGSWDERVFVVANTYHRLGCFELRRDQLADYARLLREGKAASAEALLSAIP
jgi:hypothetical protein